MVRLDDKFRFPVRPSNGNVTDPEYKEIRKFFWLCRRKDSIDNDGNVIDDDGNDIKIEKSHHEGREKSFNIKSRRLVF